MFVKVRELVDKATNIVMNYTETEAKVREATNDDPWGPSGKYRAWNLGIKLDLILWKSTH